MQESHSIERAWWVTSMVVAAALLLGMLRVVGIPAEGDPRAWLLLLPFVVPAAVAALLVVGGRRDEARAVVVGGLVGAAVTSVGMFLLAAMTMSS